jgi:hypothetical protein
MTSTRRSPELRLSVNARNASFTAPIEFDPGDRWQYGINIDWVGKAVEAVSDQKIFAPHTAETNGRNLKAAAAELSRFHFKRMKIE